VQQADGTYNIKGIGSLDTPVPFGDVRGDFGRSFKAVVDSKPGINFLAVGEMLSWNQYLDIWCRSQNVPRGKVEPKTLQEYEEILPGGLGREFGENVLFGQQFGYDGGDPTVIRPSDVSQVSLNSAKCSVLVLTLACAAWCDDDFFWGVL
jgi:hypothetical protein